MIGCHCRRRSSSLDSARRAGPPTTGRYPDNTRFADDRGNVFTLHDWKSTTLYLGVDRGVPTPEEFWADEEPYHFSIGGRGEENEDGLNLSATAFREWLLEQYRGYHAVVVMN